MNIKGLAMILALGMMLWMTAGPIAQTDADQALGPRPAGDGLTTLGDLQLGAQDRCPVCGMFPAKRPKTAAALELKDGRTFYFCGNGCLLRSVHDSQLYLGVAADRIERLRVRDYFSGAAIDARKAIWVAGSDVIGPMGPALVTLQDEGALNAFKQRHGAKQTFTLDQVDDALWRQLFPETKP